MAKPDPQDTLDQKMEEVRAVIREGNELLRDLRTAIKEAKEVQRTLPTVAEQRISQSVKAGLEEFGTTLEKALEDATKAVYRRFDTIAAICLGEDAEAIADGRISLKDMLAKSGRQRLEFMNMMRTLGIPMTDED